MGSAKKAIFPYTIDLMQRGPTELVGLGGHLGRVTLTREPAEGWCYRQTRRRPALPMRRQQLERKNSIVLFGSYRFILCESIDTQAKLN
jgi:hypothetical protein